MLREKWIELIGRLTSTAMVYGAMAGTTSELLTIESIAFHQARNALIEALEREGVVEDGEDLFFMQELPTDEETPDTQGEDMTIYAGPTWAHPATYSPEPGWDYHDSTCRCSWCRQREAEAQAAGEAEDEAKGDSDDNQT